MKEEEENIGKEEKEEGKESTIDRLDSHHGNTKARQICVIELRCNHI